MNKRNLPIVVIAALLFALWPSNAFAREMGLESTFPGLGSYALWEGVSEGGSYSGTLWTFWWEKQWLPPHPLDGEEEGKWHLRFSSLFGWRIATPEDALFKFGLSGTKSSWQVYASLLPAWGERYPDYLEVDVGMSRWDIWMPGFAEDESGDFLVVDGHLWGKFLPDSCFMPGIYLGLDLRSGRLLSHVIPCIDPGRYEP